MSTVVPAEVRRFLEEHEAEVRPLMEARSRAWWEMATTGSEGARESSESAGLALERVYSREGDGARVEGWLGVLEEGSEARRQLERLSLEYGRRRGGGELRERIVRAEAALEGRFNTYRGRGVDGRVLTQAEIEEVLERGEDEGARREAWEAAMMVGDEVSGAVRELAELRNELARELGHRDWFAYGLVLQELDEDWLLKLMARMERETRDVFRMRKEGLDERLREKLGVEGELMPWHMSDPFFQQSPGLEDCRAELDGWHAERDPSDVVTRFFDGVGMNLRPVLSVSDLEPREGKSQHAFCIDLDREGDVRILSNNRPGLRWMSTMLHEAGHAAYDRYGDRSLPWLLRCPAHVLTTEAVAMWMGRQAMDPEFLVEFIGAPVDRVTALSAGLRREQGFELLLFVRWVQVMFHFERALYANPGSDELDAEWYRLKERYQLQAVPEREGHADWAAKIHLALAPVYYPNYLLGELLASQLRASFLAESDGHSLVDNLTVGELLIARVFRPGARHRWDTMVEQATGEELDPRHFLREFGSRVG